MKDVIVMGGNYSLTLSVIRSLGMAGYKVRLLIADDSTGRIAGKSKFVTKCYDCRTMQVFDGKRSFRKIITKLFDKKKKRVDNMTFENVFLTLELLRDKDEKVLIIPVSDPYCVMLDKHANQFSKNYITPNLFNKPGEIVHFMDKMTQKKLANSCGLNTAIGEVYLTDETGIEKALKEVIYPCFMKVLISANVFKGKTLYAVCNNEYELRQGMKKAYSNNCKTVLIEEFLKPEKELCVYGVAGNGKVYIPACLETLRGGCGGHKGVTAEGLIVSAECLGETKEKLKDFVSRSGLTGLFCIDLIQTKGKVYFLEMNLRSGASIYAVTLAGANLPGTLADMIYHNSIQGPEDILQNVHFLSEMIELDMYVEGYISRNEYNAHIANIHDKLIFNETDPEPYKEFKKLAFYKPIIKRIKTLNKPN